MSTVITNAGEALITQHQAGNTNLVIDKILLANIPGQDPGTAIDRDEGKPAADKIVHEYAIPDEYKGYVTPNQVVYSMLLGSNLGDFSFNWLGLYSSTSDTVVAITHIPAVQKTATAGGTLGNNLTRNFLLEFSGAQELAGVTVQAATWQIDFTARLSGIDERERLANLDMFGRAAFWEDAFKVAKPGADFQLAAGIAYVAGVRILNESAHTITPAVLPTSVWLDVSLKPSGAGAEANAQIVFSATAKADYTDSAGVNHYFEKIADIDAVGNIADKRQVEAITDNVVDYLKQKVADVAVHLTPEGIGAADKDHTHTPQEIGAAPEDHTHEGIGYDAVARHNNALNAMDLTILAAQSGPNAIEDGVVFGFSDEEGVAVTTFIHDPAHSAYVVSNVNNGYSMWHNGDTRVGQALQLAPNTSIYKVRALFRKAGNVQGKVRASIRNASGSFPQAYPSGTVHKTAPDLDVATLPEDNTNYHWIEFDFSQGGPWVSDSSTRNYTIHFEWIDISSDENNRVYLGCNSTQDVDVDNTWRAGNASRYYGGWDPHKFNDLCLQIFNTDPATIPMRPYLKTEPVNAVATPGHITAILHIKDVDEITVNTDIIAKVSRDGGNNFTPLSLQEKVIRGGERILIGEVDVSQQPEGQAISGTVEAMHGDEFNLYEMALLWR